VTINAGVALHQLQQYNPALTEFGEARQADDASLRSIANYDRGNTLFRMERLDEAREAFKDALRDEPGNRDAKFNIEVIDRIQEEQRRQQQQQQQQDGQGEGQPQQGEGQQQPGQQGQGEGQPQQPQQPQPGQGDQGQPQQPPQQPQPGQGQPGEGQPTPSLPDALNQFRQNLSPERALQLLDALRDQQRGLDGQLDGQPRPATVPRGRAPDPLY
jgi:tetratricopeptide (TPR) repeat protein